MTVGAVTLNESIVPSNGPIVRAPVCTVMADGNCQRQHMRCGTS